MPDERHLGSDGGNNLERFLHREREVCRLGLHRVVRKPRPSLRPRLKKMTSAPGISVSLTLDRVEQLVSLLLASVGQHVFLVRNGQLGKVGIGASSSTDP